MILRNGRTQTKARQGKTTQSQPVPALREANRRLRALRTSLAMPMRLARPTSAVSRVDDSPGRPSPGSSGSPPAVSAQPLRHRPIGQPGTSRQRNGRVPVFRGTDPLALEIAKSLAKPGFQRRVQLSGLFALGERVPRRPSGGSAQRCITFVPVHCPRGCPGATIRQPLCRACGEPTLGEPRCRTCGTRDQHDRRVYCLVCAWSAYLVRD